MTDLVVIGASAGGLEAVAAICEELPVHLSVPVLVVMHVGPQGNGLLDLLQQRCALPAAYARDGALATPGIWIAAPGANLTVVKAGGAVRFRLSQAGSPHLVQPSINPLMESAAREFGAAVIGIVLSGYLDDGTAGLQHIKAAGGKAMVQDPADAAVAAMPDSVVRHVAVDAILPAAAIGPALTALMALEALKVSDGQAAPDEPGASTAGTRSPAASLIG